MYCPKCKSQDVVIYAHNGNNTSALWRCYFCGHHWEAETNMGDNYPLLPMQKDWCKEREEHKKFKDMGVVPKAKKDDTVNLLIDLWEFLKDKVKEKNGKNIN